jgi:hypothetical protein
MSLSILELLFKSILLIFSIFILPDTAYEKRSEDLIIAFANKNKTEEEINKSLEVPTMSEEEAYSNLEHRLMANSKKVVEKYENVRRSFFRLIEGAVQLPIEEKPLCRVYQASRDAFTYGGIRARSLYPHEPHLNPETIARYSCEVDADLRRITSCMMTDLLAERIASYVLLDKPPFQDPINSSMPTALQKLADRWASDLKFMRIWWEHKELSLEERVEQTSLFLAEEECYPHGTNLKFYSDRLFAAIRHQLIKRMLPPLLATAYSLESTSAEYIEEVKFLRNISKSSAYTQLTTLYTEEGIFGKHCERLYLRMGPHRDRSEAPLNPGEGADQRALRLSILAQPHINRQELQEEYAIWFRQEHKISPRVAKIWPWAESSISRIADQLLSAQPVEAQQGGVINQATSSREHRLRPNPDAVWENFEKRLISEGSLIPCEV